MDVVILTGRLTKDCELRKTNSGTDYCTNSIAVDAGYKDSQGNRVSYFFDLIAYGGQATFMTQYLHKGQLVEISGQLVSTPYTPKGTELKLQRVNVKVDSISSLERFEKKDEKVEVSDDELGY